MIYLPNQNFCFLHTPKVAGTWLRRVLVSLVPGALAVGREHGAREDAVLECGPDIQTFCFIRHPLTWYQSFWAHRELTGWGGDFAIGHSCKSRDFNTFALACAARHPGFLGEIYDRFTKDAPFIGRYESLYLDTGLILGAIGTDLAVEDVRNIPPENRGASVPGLAKRAEYSKEAAAAILESERAVIERWYS